MRFVTRSAVTIILAGLMLSACGDQKNTRKLDNIKGNQNLNNQSETTNFYTNSTLGITFRLPDKWSLENSEDKTQVRIHNKAVMGDSDQITSMEVAILDNLNNKSITSDAALKGHLENEFPTREWKSVQALGNSGYFSKSYLEGEENGEIYVYDARNQRLLSLKYQTWFKQVAKVQLANVMKTMIIDDEVPSIQDIKFVPDTAKPGDKVKLVVKASDALSGIDLSGFISALNPYPIESPLYGYLPGLQADGNGDGSSEYTYSQIFKINQPFTQIDAETFEYEFTLPENAPKGRLSFGMIEVKDYYGNAAKYTLGNSQQAIGSVGEAARFKCETDCGDFMKSYNRFYQSPVNLQVVQEKSSVERADLFVDTNDTNHIEDSVGPKVKDIYFAPTFVSKNQSTIKLIVEFEDESEIDDKLVLLNNSCFNQKPMYSRTLDSTGDYQKPNVIYNFVQPKRIDAKKYEISLDAKPCLEQDLSFATLESMIVFDQAGNESVIAFKGHQYFGEDRNHQNFDAYVRLQLIK